MSYFSTYYIQEFFFTRDPMMLHNHNRLFSRRFSNAFN